MVKRAMSYKDMAIAELNGLSTSEIREVLDFIGYLKMKANFRATKEIYSDKEIVESIRRGRANLSAGRWERWEKVRENV